MDRTLRRFAIGLALLTGLATLPVASAQRAGAPLLQVAGAERPVQLERARIESRVAAGLGETRIELVFRNPNHRVLEGNLEFPLGDGQQVTGFALDIDGALRDAVPVPKGTGRQVFEAIERRGVDPGLLEQTAGNQFRLRIYPIPAQGTRRVALTVREALPMGPKGLRWMLPLQFAQGAGQVQLQVHAMGTGVPANTHSGPLTLAPVAGAWQARWEGAGDALPAQLGWTLPLPRGIAGVRSSFEGQSYVMVQVPAPSRAQPRALPSQIGLVWDASGSGRQRDTAAELAVLDRYFRAVGTAQVQLTIVRDRAEPMKRFNVRQGDWRALRETLESLVYDGGSALGDWVPAAGVQEYLLVSDGLANYGARTRPALQPHQRLYALSGAGARTDVARLRGWVGAGGQVLVLHGAQEVPSVAERLLQVPAAPVGLAGLDIGEFLQVEEGAASGWVRLIGRVTPPNKLTGLSVGGATETTALELEALPDAGDMMAHAWAALRLRQLQAEPEINRGAIRSLSQQFGLVGPDTSLLVLETLDDYLRYGIRPPAPLQQAYDARHAVQLRDDAQARRERLDAIALQFAEREQWWNRRWPKGDRPVVAEQAKRAAARSRAHAEERIAFAPGAVPPPPPAPAPAMYAEAPRANDSATLDRVQLTGARIAEEADAGPANSGQMRIALGAWEPDSLYARRLRVATPSQLYPLYLREREDHADSSAFYLDVADLLLAKGQRDLALRVLSNLAEMQLENRHVLRVLGYRLMQAKAPELAVPVFRQVLAMGEEEPQSFRDLGLALEAAGQPAEALAALNEVVVRPWDSRFDGISLIALDELNTLVARTKVDASAVDPRLRRAMPLDLRVVLSWDSDNSDMDLWVTDPNGERAYYGNRLTYQGGQMSRDFTGGYGPEQFSLRDAKPGKYKVEANYFGSREQVVTGATTLMLRLSTKWGGAGQRDQYVTMRLKDDSETVLVGEFEVR
jgi:Ca-activated chloride channel homolog